MYKVRFYLEILCHLTLLALLAFVAPADAQQSNPGVQQSGAVTANDCVRWGPGVGQIRSTGAPCASQSSGANPTATAGPNAVNGAATTFMRSDGAPAVQLGTAAQPGIVQVDGTTITATAGVISGTVTQSVGANPSATASDIAVNGVATTFMRSDAAPAVQKGSNAQFGIVEGDGTTVSCVAGVCGAVVNGIFPTPTRAGDVVYWNGSAWVTLPGNNSGTQVLSENASGVPSWSAAGTGTVTSAVTAAGTGISVSGTCTITSSGTCTVTNTGVVTVKKQIFTAGGTYTPSAGMLYADIECVGSGGGGGASIISAAVGQNGGGGGGGGEMCRKLATAADIGASKAVTVGAAGTGGAAGANNGTAGAAVSVGTLCVANGGGGGIHGAVASFGTGAAGGTGGTGDFLTAGGSGGSGPYSTVSPATTMYSQSGAGGSSLFGAGGRPVQDGTGSGGATAGVNGAGYGAGGSGSLTQRATSGTNSAAGGNGTTGACYITEYNSQ